MASNMISRMDELNENDSKHVDVVHNEFREDLRKLTLKFIAAISFSCCPYLVINGFLYETNKQLLLK